MRSRIAGWLGRLIRLPARWIPQLFTEPAVRVWVATASFVTILGLPLALLQLNDLRDQRTSRSMQGLLMVDQQLNAEGNRSIRHRILAARPLLQPKGPVTPEELGDYLDTLESLAAMRDQGLIDLDTVGDWFGDIISRTYRNAEVLAFMRQQQDQDPEAYTGFEDLAKHLPPRAPPKRSAAPEIKQAR